MSTADKIQTAILVANFGMLLALGVSVRVATTASFATVYQGLADQMHDINKFFVENPETRRYFYAGKSPPTDELELDRLEAIAEMIVDFADNFTAQRRSLPDRYESGWTEYFQSLFKTSFVLQKYWRENAVWYGEDLKKIFDDAAKLLAENG
jgi:hypothetical protein